jgi:8-oxo-dGTP pyrophosphatase MutT (NUDIX family)
MMNNCPNTSQGWRDLLSDKVLSRPDLAPAGLRASSVLVPVIIDDARPYLILTKRTAHLPNHAGQICFPGGKIDQGESVMDAALRESEEEIGLKPDQVEPLGYLSAVVAAGQFHIAPVLGVVKQSVQLSPDPGEVERIIALPLDIALNSSHYREELIHYQPTIKTWVIDHHEEYIWGATARIIVQWHAAITSTNPFIHNGV